MRWACSQSKRAVDEQRGFKSGRVHIHCYRTHGIQHRNLAIAYVFRQLKTRGPLYYCALRHFPPANFSPSHVGYSFTRQVRSVQIIPIKTHLHESLSGSKHAPFAVWYNCHIVLLFCYVTFALFETVWFLATCVRSPTGVLQSSEKWHHLSGTTLLLTTNC
jgi:hypothetical protein